MKFRCHSIQIIRHDQRCRQHGPDRHLRLALFQTQSKVSDQQHVRIVPVSRTSIRLNSMLVLCKVFNNASHRFPRVLNVVPISPQIAVLFDQLKIGHYSVFLLVHWPTARVNHRSAGLVEQSAKVRISFVHCMNVRIATVQLHIVHTPFGKCACIDLLVANNARITATRVRSIVLVDAELQSFRMYLVNSKKLILHAFYSPSTSYIVAESFHATGKAHRIR